MNHWRTQISPEFELLWLCDPERKQNIVLAADTMLVGGAVLAATAAGAFPVSELRTEVLARCGQRDEDYE